MSNIIKHPYHLVEISPWPLYASISAIGLTSGIVSWFHIKEIDLFYRRLALILAIIHQWWRDISREGSYQGLHTDIVEIGLRWGIMLFITSEVIFFFSFFWAFFHSSLSPNIELGCSWPPTGVEAFNPWKVPLTNTIILLSSGLELRGHITLNRRYLFKSVPISNYYNFVGRVFFVNSAAWESRNSFPR